MASAGSVMYSPQQSAEVPNTRTLSVGAGILGGGTLAADRTFTMGFASEAQGDIAIRGASAWARLAAGTSGQALITGGAAANPAWGVDFGAQNLTTTGTVHGAAFTGAGTVSTTGVLRVASAVTAVAARNAGGTADNVLIATDGSDDVLLGDGTNTPIIAMRATTNVQIQIGGGSKFTVSSTTATIGVAIAHTGTTAGFFSATPASKPTVSGAKGSNAALGSLMTALATLGLVTDSTSA